ncbi:MAG: HEAT repeat domain-containing protein [Candidatus Hodarchaeales archaeon]|jgi:HEAT repeat protein
MESYRNIVKKRDDPSKNWIQRRDIIRPLIDLGTPEAIEMVYDLLLTDPNSSVRMKAAKLLTQSKDPNLANYLIKSLKDWDSGIRLRVLQTLNEIQIGNFKELKSVLIDIEEKDNRDNIKNEIRKLFQKQAKILGVSVEKLRELE